MLSDDFDVVGVATSGAEAVDMLPQAQPDVIVLDGDMPGLRGFETVRAFERARLPKTPVVFLSMHEADEIVGEAFRCGGLGYVMKSRVSRDLPTALDQALRGRRFVPSLTSLFELVSDRGHVMQVHHGVESFLDGAAAFFNVALRRGDATCLIGTERIRQGVADRLRRRGWNVGGSSGHKRCLIIDAADALPRFMRNGLPDRDRLAEIAAE